jgi:hypothetical protein
VAGRDRPRRTSEIGITFTQLTPERTRVVLTYTALVLRTTASFARPAHDALIWEHGRRNMALVEAGLLAVVLPVTDGSGAAGYGVFTTDLETTRRVMDSDPTVRAGIFDHELHPVRGFPGATLP